MAYARFSSNDYQSSIYMYDSERGIDLHVAQHATTLTAEQLEDLGPNPLLEVKSGIVDLAAYRTRSAKLQAYLDKNEAITTPINHPLAGQSAYFSDPEEAMCTLEELSEAGANIPEHVFEALQEEVMV